MPAKLWTIGYEKRTVAELIAILKGAEIGVLVDVRANPFSRKEGFSARKLNSTLRLNGIVYRHQAGLGAKKEHRDALDQDKNYKKFFKAYRNNLLMRPNSSLAILRSIIDGDQNVAVMCYEANPEECHRSALCDVMRDGDKDLEVIHLPLKEEPVVDSK